ncbi:MAG: O-antigen ligase family protein [Patescibacteria group bacterium]
MGKIWQKVNFYFLLTLIVYMPLQFFLDQFLHSRTELADSTIFWSTHWYEPFLIIFFLITALKAVIEKKVRLPLLMISLVVLFGLVSVLLLSPDIGRGLEGFRFSLLALLFLGIGVNLDLSARSKTSLINTYLISAFLMAGLALVERFLPYYYWSGAGLLDISQSFGWGFFDIGKKIYQSSSLIGAPNQLGSYLLPALFLLLFRIKQINIRSAFYILLSILLALAILLTFSRSALVALVVGLLIFIFFFIKNLRILSWFLSILCVFIVIVALSFSRSENIRNLITHDGDTGHLNSFNITLNEIKNRYDNDKVKFAFGSGLGTAGPASVKYGDGITSESWYLQFALELGALGLLLWLGLTGYLLLELFKIQKALFLGLVSVSVCALFLHTFADNPAIAYTIFILIGVSLNKEQYGKNIN